jgi:hypothetical protein
MNPGRPQAAEQHDLTLDQMREIVWLRRRHPRADLAVTRAEG